MRGLREVVFLEVLISDTSHDGPQSVGSNLSILISYGALKLNRKAIYFLLAPCNALVVNTTWLTRNVNLARVLRKEPRDIR